MKPTVLVYTILLLATPCFAKENPFLPMINQPYGQYAKPMIDQRIRLDLFMEQPEADTLMMHIRQAAEIAGNTHWKLEQELMEITYRFRSKVRSGNNYTIEHAIADYHTLSNHALAAKDTLMYLRMQRDLMNAYYVFAGNYAHAFDIAYSLRVSLEHIPADSLPDKLLAYNDMINMYYRFCDYEEAEKLLNAIVDEHEVAMRLHLLRNVYNTLGLIYYRHYKDPVMAQSYFKQILALVPEGNESADHLKGWEGIANGNIGRMLAEDGKYNEAIPLIEHSRRLMDEIGDYSFAANMAILLANIYLKQDGGLYKQSAILQAGHNIEQAQTYIARAYPPPNRIELYEVKSKYFTVTGKSTLGLAYMDSAIYAREAYHQEFNALELKRSEQRAHLLEQRAKDEELHVSQLNTRWYRNVVILVVVALVLLSSILVAFVYQYLHKRAAYRVLARKLQETAKCAVQVSRPGGEMPAPTANEDALMQSIYLLMEEEHPYTDPNFSLNELADRLEVNRTYISATINRCSGKSFTDFLSEFRVSEAVRILSDPKNAKLTIDAVAEASGFNYRNSFYRTFKKVTGMTPSAFRENIAKTPRNSTKVGTN